VGFIQDDQAVEIFPEPFLDLLHPRLLALVFLGGFGLQGVVAEEQEPFVALPASGS